MLEQACKPWSCPSFGNTWDPLSQCVALLLKDHVSSRQRETMMSWLSRPLSAVGWRFEIELEEHINRISEDNIGAILGFWRYHQDIINIFGGLVAGQRISWVWNWSISTEYHKILWVWNWAVGTFITRFLLNGPLIVNYKHQLHQLYISTISELL